MSKCTVTVVSKSNVDDYFANTNVKGKKMQNIQEEREKESVK